MENEFDLFFADDGDIAFVFFGIRPLPLEPIAMLMGQQLTVPFIDGSELTFALWPEEPAKLCSRGEVGLNSVPPGAEGKEQFVIARVVQIAGSSA